MDIWGEVIAEVDDIDAYYDAMKAKGVRLVDADGKPFEDDKKAFVLEPFGTRGAYFPKDASGGMTIQIYQRGPRETDIMHRRDDAWKSY